MKTENLSRILTDGSGRENIIVQALQECQAAIDAGRPLDRSALLKKYPDIQEELSACLDGLELMRVSSATSTKKDGAPLKDLQKVAPAATLGDFKIVREIGKGGMGVVYEAEQLSVGRKVALKVLPYAAMLDKRQVARFQNEARAAATLEHSNIVPVYFVGNERGVYFYAMRLIQGKNLAEVITELCNSESDEGRAKLSMSSSQLLLDTERERDAANESKAHASGDTIRESGGESSTSLGVDSGERGKVYYRSVARIVKQAAEALEFAHSHGIVHRDVKPANILLDELGDAWVTDFGLARIESDGGMTMTGDLVGTLRYMSPEQTLAKRVTVDHRSDVYSLGATLYELLSLQTLFDGTDRADLLKKIAFEEPKAPSKIDKNVPKDLETIVLKALQKNPDDRYQSALYLADDLQRFIDNEPVKARPTPLSRRIGLWTQRNPVITLSAAIVGTLLLISTATIGLLIANNEHNLRTQEGEASAALAKSLEEKLDQQALALRAAKLAEARNYINQIRLSSAEWTFGDHTIAREALASTNESLRGWEYDYLKNRFISSIESEQVAHEGPITAVQYSPNGQLILTASHDGTIKLWNAENYQAIRTLTGHDGEVNDCVFFPDGTRLASAGTDGTIRIWETETGNQLLQIDESRSVDAIAVSSKSNLLVAGVGESLRFWNTNDGKLTRTIDNMWGNVTCVTFTSDGRYVSCGTDDHVIDIWTVKEKPANKIGNGIFSAIVAGAFDAYPFEARIRSIQGRVESVKFLHKDYDPLIEQPFLVGTGQDHTIRMFDWYTEEELERIKAHSGPVLCADISQDDSLLVTGSQDRTILIWKLVESGDYRLMDTQGVLRGHNAAVTSVSIRHDGKCLASVGSDRKLIIWNLETQVKSQNVFAIPPAIERERNSPFDEEPISGDSERPAREKETKDLQSTTLSLDGSRLARTIHPDSQNDQAGRTEVWSVRDRKLVSTLDVKAELVAWSTDAEFLATADATGKVQIWRSEDGFLVSTLPGSSDSAPIAMTFGRDDKIYVLDEQGIIVWNALTKARLNMIPHPCTAFELGPQERIAALVDSSGQIAILNMESGELAEPIQLNRGDQYAMAFSSDGKYLACGSSADREIQIVEVKSNSIVDSLTGHYEGVTDLEFLPNGNRLVSASADNSARLWDWQNGEELLNFRGHESSVLQISISPDASAIFSLDDEHTVRRWSTE